jgi:hypothetical protein
MRQQQRLLGQHWFGCAQQDAHACRVRLIWCRMCVHVYVRLGDELDKSKAACVCGRL